MPNLKATEHAVARHCWALVDAASLAASRPARTANRILRPRRLQCDAESIVVMAAHVDDELMGCGGCLLLHQRAGAQIQVVYTVATQAEREAEGKELCRLLGLADPVFLGRASNGGADSGAVERLAGVLVAAKPSLLYSHAPVDCHHEHVECAKVVAAALRLCSADAPIRAYGVQTPLTPILSNGWTDITQVAHDRRAKLSVMRSQQHMRGVLTRLMGLERAQGMLLTYGGRDAVLLRECSPSGYLSWLDASLAVAAHMPAAPRLGSRTPLPRFLRWAVSLELALSTEHTTRDPGDERH